MRYSMLVYLTKMCETLEEAAAYISAEPDSEVSAELIGNGHTMLAQIRTELGRHEDDLKSARPLELLAAIEGRWGCAGAEELVPLLSDFAGALPSEISYQVRAVFFAELGEKWDSMESVYELMRDDPRFDPVVVRTPVFRVVKRDGKQEQDVIYKDFLTPMGIPSLGYDQYSLEEDCPDLAFISQPYEGCTLRQFWPETIAKNTRLVYLPYYLPDMVHQNSVMNLCRLPVYRWAWKTVCATEKHLAFYRKHALNGGANALLTGLPKLDPLVTLRERGAELPQGWERVRGKKAFLWNNWYDAKVSTLRFADEILSWFEGHPDCALIWRPHPMTDTVTKLYCPDIYPAYKTLLRRVKDMPNAVIDELASYQAAFCYSDAQISDYSSLLPQYLLMDKPALMIRNDRAWGFTGVEFIGSQWLEQTDCADGILAFLDRIRQREDRNAEIRRQILQRELPLADGHSGERTAESLWAAMHTEDGSPL